MRRLHNQRRIQIVAREIPPRLTDNNTEIVRCDRISSGETRELAALCLGVDDVPEELMHFLQEVASSNACYIQESVAALRENQFLAVQKRQLVLLKHLDIDIISWAHTRMVGCVLCQIVRLSPAQEQVLKLAVVFENDFSAFDLKAAGLGVFGGAHCMTLYDLVKAFMAAESLVQEGLLMHHVTKEPPDYVPPDTRRWTMRNVLVRKIVRASILESQRVVIKRSALLSRALYRANLTNNVEVSRSKPSNVRYKMRETDAKPHVRRLLRTMADALAKED